MFEQWSRTWADECAKNAKDAQNQQIQKYRLMTQAAQLACCKPDSPIRIPADVYEYPNIHTKVGYGTVDPCAIEDNNKMFLGPDRMTHARCKQQLFSRVFQGVPNLRPGEPQPDAESKILQGISTPMLECAQYVPKRELTEVTYDKFIPMIEPLQRTVQNPETIVEPWKRGGEVTREYVKNEDFLRSCGLKA